MAVYSRRQAIDASYHRKAEGMFPVNERRRCHGTKRECNVGDLRTTPTGSSKSLTRSMCIFMQRPFRKKVCAPVLMSGKGAYDFGRSSKRCYSLPSVAAMFAHDGTFQGPMGMPIKSHHLARPRAMLVCCVLAANAKDVASGGP